MLSASRRSKHCASLDCYWIAYKPDYIITYRLQHVPYIATFQYQAIRTVREIHCMKLFKTSNIEMLTSVKLYLE